MRKRQRKRSKKIVYIVLLITFFGVTAGLVFFILPQIIVPISLSPKEPEIIKANATFGVFEIKDAMLRKNIPFDSVNVSSSSGGIVASLTKGTKVYFGYDKEIDWQISSLQQILTRLTIENKQPQVIDLRYNRPIVKF